MKILKNLLCLSFLILITYSCEPEELPGTTTIKHENISAGTGDQADEVENPHED